MRLTLRHIDRKMFKMRELRGAGVVTVRHIPGEQNPRGPVHQDSLSGQAFEKHRKFVLNLPGGAAVSSRATSFLSRPLYVRGQTKHAEYASSPRDGTGAP